MLRLAFSFSRRYFFARTNKSVINIISGISMLGIASGTAALIIILSIFNGLDNLIRSLIDSFNPDIEITAKQGKFFDTSTLPTQQIGVLPGIAHYSIVLEESGLLEYDGKQFIAQIKGVDQNFEKVTGIDTMMYRGEFNLYKNEIPQAIAGAGVAYRLQMSPSMLSPLKIWFPKQEATYTLDPTEAFNLEVLELGGVFSIQQEYDSKYVFVPVHFIQQLLERPNAASAIEIKLDKHANITEVQAQLSELLGETFSVKNRLEQNEALYKMMQTEKWATIAIFALILVIASFNMIGSLTMLILDKQHDIGVLSYLGGKFRFIRSIFLYNGWLITLGGALIGIFVGGSASYMQQRFELIKFPQEGNYIISSYPVSINASDFVLVILTVYIIGMIINLIPLRLIQSFTR